MGNGVLRLLRHTTAPIFDSTDFVKSRFPVKKRGYEIFAAQASAQETKFLCARRGTHFQVFKERAYTLPISTHATRCTYHIGGQRPFYVDNNTVPSRMPLPWLASLVLFYPVFPTTSRNVVIFARQFSNPIMTDANIWNG